MTIIFLDVWHMLEDGHYDTFERMLEEYPNMVDSFHQRKFCVRMCASWSFLIRAVETENVNIFIYLLKHKPDFFFIEPTSGKNVVHFILGGNSSDKNALKMIKEMCKLLNPNEIIDLFNVNDRDFKTPMRCEQQNYNSPKKRTVEFMSINGGESYIEDPNDPFNDMRVYGPIQH